MTSSTAFVRQLSVVGAVAVGVLVIPLLILNIFSGAVGGVWLAIVGEWRLMLYGVVLMVVMPWMWIVASLPAMGLVAAFGGLGEKYDRPLLAVFAGAVFAVWSMALVVAWVAFVFLQFTDTAGQSPVIPLLLWGYATVNAPLASMASKEPADSTGTWMALLLADLTYILLSILLLAGATSAIMIGSAASIGAVSALSVVISIAVAGLRRPRPVSADEFNLDEAQAA